MGRRKRPGYPTSQKTNNSIVGKEENECPVPDPNRTMTSITTELSDVHKKISHRGNYG
jgi:hypothetical protein